MQNKQHAVNLKKDLFNIDNNLKNLLINAGYDFLPFNISQSFK